MDVGQAYEYLRSKYQQAAAAAVAAEAAVKEKTLQRLEMLRLNPSPVYIAVAAVAIVLMIWFVGYALRRARRVTGVWIDTATRALFYVRQHGQKLDIAYQDGKAHGRVDGRVVLWKYGSGIIKSNTIHWTTGRIWERVRV
jgi:hypothetical protein